MAEFGTPETWNMKVGDFIETQLPQEKPQALLDLQEQNRKQRLLNTLQKIGPGLMDESLDFIRRENFSKGSLPKNVQDFLIETFPDVDFDFTRPSKYGVSFSKKDPESVNLYARIERAAKAKIKNPDYTVNPAQQAGGEGQAYSVKKAEEAVAEFKKKNNRLPYPKELPKVIGKSKTQTYRILNESNKNLTTPFPQDEEGVLMKKNIAEENKSIKKGMDIIKQDYKKFKKTALPNQSYAVSSNLSTFRDVDGNKITLSGSPKTRNKIIDNLIEEGLDITRVPESATAVGGEKITGGLSKEERNYFKNNYKKQSLGKMTRKFLPKGTGTTTAAYDDKISQFQNYRTGLLNQELIKDEDLIKPLEFEPKPAGQADRESSERRTKSLKKLGTLGQEETFMKIKREIADEIYGKKAFVKDERGNTRVRIDQGHRGGYDQFKKLGANYPISSVGPDLDDINRKNVKLVENKLEPFYEKQVSLFNKAKKNLTPELRKSIDTNNKDIAELVAKAQFDDPDIKGRIIGVQVDPFNLKVGTTPIDYTKALDLGVLDNAIRIGVGTQGKIDKALIKETYKSLLLKEGEEQGFLKKGIKIPTEEFKPGLQPDGRLVDLPGQKSVGFLGGEEAAKAAGRSLLTALKVLGQPSIAAGFAADELSKGNIKTAGASLLAPELVGSFAPKGRGLLSLAGRIAANPFGKAARAFTPVGLATIGAGALYDVYKEYERRQALTDEERLEEDIERDRAASEMMVGAAEGGRIGFADGPDDPSKRKFIKLMGIMSLLPFGIGKGIKMATKAAPVVAEGAKLGMDKLLLLVDKIKKFGTDVSSKFGTKEREKVITYEGKDGSQYDLYEDLSTGDIRVEKNKTGVGSSGDKTYDTIEDKSTFEIRKGEEFVKDEGLETQKVIKADDEYEEGKAVFDQDGTVADFDEVDDITIKAIEDEIN